MQEDCKVSVLFPARADLIMGFTTFPGRMGLVVASRNEVRRDLIKVSKHVAEEVCRKHLFFVSLHKLTKGHSGKNWQIQYSSTLHSGN